MIRVSKLRKCYRNYIGVDNLSFEVEKGEIFGLVGPNGAGKTTTLKILAGLIEPTSGEVEIAGLPISNPKVKKLIGFVPEESPVYEDMGIKEYLSFFAEIYGIEKDKAEKRIITLLDSLNISPNGKRLGELSKGNKRKVIIARSLIADPPVLIYDEPASGLDPLTSHYIMELIGSMRGKKTIILSTHNLYQAESICDRILILKEGKEVICGRVGEIKEKFGNSNENLENIFMRFMK